MAYFEDHKPGRAIAMGARTLHERDLAAFVEWSGDRYPLRPTPEFAQASGRANIIVHGPLVLSLAQGLMTAAGLFNDGALAFLGLIWRMQAHALPGDTLRAEVTVASRRDSRSDPTRGIVKFSFFLLKQRDELVREGTWTQLLAKRPVQA
ncbi:MAG: dehydratase [Hyphomicrobiales bacterium]|nr:dehydratase [Hyphomicrobiales bacterium]